MAVSCYYPERLSQREWDAVFDFASAAQAAGYRSLILVNGTPEELSEMLGERSSLVSYSDWKTLITFNRSNGGVTYLADGQVIRKWPAIRRPGQDSLESMIQKDPTDVMAQGTSRGQVFQQAFLLYVFAVMLLI